MRHKLSASWIAATVVASWTGIVIVTLVTMAQLIAGLFSFQAERSMIAVCAGVLWVVFATVMAIRFASPIMRTLGFRAGSRSFQVGGLGTGGLGSGGKSKIQRIRRSKCFTNLEQQLRALRSDLILLAVVPFVVSMADAVLNRLDREAASTSFGWLTLLFALVWLIAGAFVWTTGPSVYRRNRAHQIRNSLRFYHRGVALRSFIAAWDNPGRNVYASCRLSARIATAHRTFFLAAAGCFGLAGCIAARIHTFGYAGEILTLVSIGLIFSLWPTSHRLVQWSAQILDPFCDDPDEYDEY